MRYHLWSAWGGVVFVLFFAVGWSILGGFAPPPISPALDANAIAHFYQGNTTLIRLGLNLVMIGCATMVPFYTALGIQMSRMEGKWPLLSISQVILGFANVLFFYIPVILWQTAAFRPDRDPQITQAFNDLAWMIIMWPFGLAAMQNIVIAAAIFSDGNKPGIFPRWFAYFNIWVAISLAAGIAIPFFKTGPFAWDGLFGYWLPTICYLGWIIITSVLLVRVVKKAAAAT